MELRAFLSFGLIVLFMFSFTLLLFFSSRYKRCPSDMLLVVYGAVGKNQTSRCIHGGGSFIWPIIQDYAYMSLTPIQLSIPVSGIPGSKSWGPQGELKLGIKISTEPARMHNAAEHLINMNQDQIEALAQGIISSELRANARELEAAGKDNDQLALQNAMRNALDESLGKVGLEILHL